MTAPGILSRLTATTQHYAGSGVIGQGVKREDVLQALHGIDPGKVGFVLYIYGNARSRHDFFSGLFIETMQRHEVQLWIEHRRAQRGYYRPIEALCLLAVAEWGQGKMTAEARAKLMGVSRGTWNRKYRDIYDLIVKIPDSWASEVSKIVSERLK